MTVCPRPCVFLCTGFSVCTPMTSLYIHIPFCQKKCYFCSFVVAVGKDHHMDSYLDCLDREAGFYQGQQLKTVYIGGGTPSLLSHAQLERLVGIVRKDFRMISGCEFTLEANPATFDFSKAQWMHELGINRLSLGVQSLNDRYLQFLGRAHNADEARIAFETLRKAGFDNINLDLMYSFPGQTNEEMREDAQGMAGFGSEHLSLYTLTIEEGSRFYKRNFSWQDGFSQAEQYTLMTHTLEDLGFHQYEISNFAKPGRESGHNRVYWQADNYIGLGVGAHSHKDGQRYWNVPNLMEYIHRLKENRNPLQGKEKLEPRTQFKEALLFGLRMNQGVDVGQLQERFQCALTPDEHEIFEDMVAEGFLHRDNFSLTTTAKGRLVLDELAARLI